MAAHPAHSFTRCCRLWLTSLLLALSSWVAWGDSATQAKVLVWTAKAELPKHGSQVVITVDSTEVPELFDWGKNAAELCVQWYPKLCLLLDGSGFKPSTEVRLILRKDMTGVAATSDNEISIAAGYVRHATNDWGMVIHELVHVVQAYGPRRNPGWLVEGVADYVRLTQFEPDAPRPRIDPQKASYRDAYKTTAIFLIWVEAHKDANLVRKLNQAMREGAFRLDLFKVYTGETVDALWAEFTQTLSAEAK